MDPVMSNLSAKINAYSLWRETLIATIDRYIDWLTLAEVLDASQQLRLYDIKDILKKDRLVLAFLAEFSRGKTETINALFFSDFNQRLLPSEPGRTTMCPNEIFWDANEEPCIKLLPIESRDSDDSLNFLKSTPAIWHKIRLDLSSPDEMKETLRALVQTKEVDLERAKNLGFWDETDSSMVQLYAEKGMVEIPQWRHALINYPHPLLQHGLVVIDTPGLNSMGAEPELTLSIIPQAHAVLFLTTTDTGMTKSDMKIWTDYVHKRAVHKLVILNKIDLLWDGLETDAEVEALINKQIQNTARELGIDDDHIYAISAQKALLAKIKKDEDLLKRSGISRLENALAEQMIMTKHEILGRSVVTECSNMIRISRKHARTRVNQMQLQRAELAALQTQNVDISKDILAEVVAERKSYESSLITFNEGSERIKKMGDKLLRHLSLTYLETTLAEVKRDMGDSWTTLGLNTSIREMVRLATRLAEEITLESQLIKKQTDSLYQLFCKKHGFEKSEAVALNLDEFILQMQSLETMTNNFCADPVNLLTEKRFVIRKFFLGLGAQTQVIFEQMLADCKRWLSVVIAELQAQISTHKLALDKRAQSLMQSHSSSDQLTQQLALASQELAQYQQQCQQLDLILLQLLRCAKFSPDSRKLLELSLSQNLSDEAELLQPEVLALGEVTPVVSAPFISGVSPSANAAA
jgi:hypothetical protein